METFKQYLVDKKALTADEFDAISSHINEKIVKKGAVLLRQDEVCSEVYFVEEGLLRGYMVDEAGKEHLLQFAPEGWWMSDRNSFLYKEPSQIFIDAIEDSKLLVITNEFFEQATLIPTFSSFNIKILHNQVRAMQHRVGLLIGASAETRYMDFINRYPNLMLRVPQWMIASYLGITPESLSRIRKELAKRNFKPAKD